MELSHKQKTIMNNIIMKEISQITDEMLRHPQKYYTDGYLTGKRITQVTSLILERINDEVDDSNSVISHLRGQARKFRKFHLGVEDMEDQPSFPFNGVDDLESYITGFDVAYDELMSQSKKRLQNHNTKGHYQSKVCIRSTCYNELDNLATLVNRGFVCQECEPIESLDE